jgi:uncharacterized membrane protein YfcA
MRSWTVSAAKRRWLVAVIGLFAIVSVIRGRPPDPTALGIVLLCFFCEFLDSSLGMGYGTTLTPVLLAFGFTPLQLVPSILFSEFLSGLASSYFHHETGNVDFAGRTRHSRVALLLSVGSVVGVAVGVALAVRIPAPVLKLAIGAIITAAGLVILCFHLRVFAYRTWKLLLLAAVASFNKALSGGGYGPLMTSGQVLSGIEGRASVGITSFAEGVTCLVGVLLFLAQGERLDADLLVPMVTGALLSIPFSTLVVSRLEESTLRRCIAWFTIALGIFTIWKALR